MHNVGGVRLPQALDFDVILVTPEIRDDHARGHIGPEHRGHHDSGLVGDVAPMFHACLVSHRISPGGDVTERPHIRRASPPGFVTDHAVVDLDAATL
ncbi:Uncharacterised protein [Mycobacterium tuberculosis]|nr:Uncharacterised protein [Mycobacterium tuberculosis]CNV56388.1 Uncharacterised protein [Mycobacterium tuberculosis]